MFRTKESALLCAFYPSVEGVAWHVKHIAFLRSKKCSFSGVLVWMSNSRFRCAVVFCTWNMLSYLEFMWAMGLYISRCRQPRNFAGRCAPQWTPSKQIRAYPNLDQVSPTFDLKRSRLHRKRLKCWQKTECFFGLEGGGELIGKKGYLRIVLVICSVKRYELLVFCVLGIFRSDVCHRSSWRYCNDPRHRRSRASAGDCRLRHLAACGLVDEDGVASQLPVRRDVHSWYVCSEK